MNGIVGVVTVLYQVDLGQCNVSSGALFCNIILCFIVGGWLWRPQPRCSTLPELRVSFTSAFGTNDFRANCICNKHSQRENPRT